MLYKTVLDVCINDEDDEVRKLASQSHSILSSIVVET